MVGDKGRAPNSEHYLELNKLKKRKLIIGII